MFGFKKKEKSFEEKVGGLVVEHVNEWDLSELMTFNRLPWHIKNFVEVTIKEAIKEPLKETVQQYVRENPEVLPKLVKALRKPFGGLAFQGYRRVLG